MRKRALVRVVVLLALVMGLVPVPAAYAEPANIDVGIVKTDGGDYYAPGTTSTYTIVVTNYGDPVIGAHVTDYLPAGLTGATWTATFDRGMGMIGGIGAIDQYINLAAGGSAVYTMSCQVDSLAVDDITNTASVDVAGDVDPSNNVASDTDTKGFDVYISNSDESLVYTPGGTIDYFVYVYNRGDVAQTGLAFTDVFSLASFSSLTWSGDTNNDGLFELSGTGNISETIDVPANGQVYFKVSGTVYPEAVGTLTSTASVTVPSNDAHPANNTVTDTSYCLPVTDLAISTSDDLPSCTPGLSTTYTIVASNSGPSVAYNARIMDTLTAMFDGAEWTAVFTGALSGGSTSGTGGINEAVTLDVGGSVTYTMVMDIASSAVGAVANTVSVTPALGGLDPDLADNTSVDIDASYPVVELAVSNTDGVSKYVPGWYNTYTITVTNAGPSDLVGGTLVDTMPLGIHDATWSAVYQGEGSAGPATGSGNLNVAFDLAAGGTACFTVVAPITADASGDIANAAQVLLPFGTTNFGASGAVDVDTQGTSADLPSLAVYRFYNTKNGTHFYTSSADEKNAVLAKWPDVFALDGVAYHAPSGPGTLPLYRFYNTKTGTHFYTCSEEEKNAVLAKWPGIFSLDGVAYSVSPSQRAGMIPVYRLYNGQTGAHFYTAGEAEKNSVLAAYPQFSLEGVAFYVLP